MPTPIIENEEAFITKATMFKLMDFAFECCQAPLTPREFFENMYEFIGFTEGSAGWDWGQEWIEQRSKSAEIPF